MPVYSVHSIPLQTDYKSSICSKATLSLILLSLLTFIPPILIAYRSEGFWRKLDWYTEQPNVHFKRQLIVILEMGDESQYVVWSTYDNLNQLMEGHFQIPLIKFREEDTNRDGINNYLDLVLEFAHLTPDSSVQSVTLMLFFDYQLNRFCRLEMEGMGYIQHSSPLSGLELQFMADLQLEQRVPLPHSGIDTQYNESVIKEDSIYAKDYDMGNILKNYWKRNVTTVLKNVYSTWKTGRGDNQPFVIHITVNYPQQLVLYTTGFWQLMKQAWMQYLSILVVFISLIRRIKTYIFQNHIISTMVWQPIHKPHQL